MARTLFAKVLEEIDFSKKPVVVSQKIDFRNGCLMRWVNFVEGIRRSFEEN